MMMMPQTSPNEPSVGVKQMRSKGCIDCDINKPDADFSLEHILPDALGGDLLPPLFHASLQVTMDRYGHLFPSEDHKKAMDQIAKGLFV